MGKYLHPGQLGNFARSSENFSILSNMSIEFADDLLEINKGYVNKLTKGSSYFSLTCQRRIELQINIMACLKLRGLETSCFTMDTVWRFIPGLGSAHIHETGISLEHIYGLPYLGGSSCKGITKQYVLEYLLALPGEPDLNCLANLIETGDDIKCMINGNNIEGLKAASRHMDTNNNRHELTDDQAGYLINHDEYTKTLLDARKIFGFQETQGLVLFLDAFPQTLRTSQCIMTPHHLKYYGSSSSWPADSDPPTPIPFLTIEDATYLFGIAAKDNNLLTIASSWLKKALECFGAGAKTAVNYGYFSNQAEFKNKIEIRVNEFKAIAERRKIRQQLSPVERTALDIAEKPFENAKKLIELFSGEAYEESERVMIENSIVNRLIKEIPPRNDPKLDELAIEILLEKLSRENQHKLACYVFKLKRFRESPEIMTRLRNFVPHDSKYNERISEILQKINSAIPTDIKEGLTRAGKVFDDPLVSDDRKKNIAEVVLKVKDNKAIKRKLLSKTKKKAQEHLQGEN